MLKEKIKIRLQVYSELVGKSEDEALYYALGIAKMFYELQKKYDEQADIKIPIIKHPLQLDLELRQERIYAYNKIYYAKNKNEINSKRRELKLIKERHAQ